MVTPHAVLLQALGAVRDDAPLRIVQRDDEDFLAGLLDDLAAADWTARVHATTLTGHPLALYQPVHRVFHVALAEVLCQEPGLPRLDPARIVGAGLVVRRVGVPTHDGKLDPVHEAWLRAPDGTRAWRSLATLRDDELDRWDPEPARRTVASSGNAEVDRQLHDRRRRAMTSDRLALEDGAEESTTLFVAPPPVCRATRRTVLFGLIPTTSPDTTTAPTPTYNDADLDAAVPHYLKATAEAFPGDERKPLPPDLSGAELSRYDADRLDGRPFMTMLALLTVSLGLYPRSPDASSAPEMAPLLAALDHLDFNGTRGSEFLGTAARALIWRTTEKVTMPTAWPEISDAVARQIRDAMRPALTAQAAKIVPDEGRFEPSRATYVARAFVRVRSDDGCPPRTLWSAPSAVFTIKPWHAASPRPPLRVALPDILSDGLEAIKPNVAFVVPKGLAAFLHSNTAKSLLKGSGGKGTPSLAWICGFNIPIITLCAFIVLVIFLSLLNFVFWWLPFVKVCIPIPSSLTKNMERS